VSSTFPHFGALTATHTTAMLHDPLEERVWVYDVDRAHNTVRYRARNSDFTVDLPLDPMHGTVGVAPGAFEARMTIVPDAHGGNMDTPELRAGVTVYFGVNVEGALFALGDGHARQGQGEVSGVGIESAMETVVAVDLIKGVGTPWPRLESDDEVMSTGSARPLEDAFRISQHDLVTWVADAGKLDVLDAYQLISQAGEAPAGNVVDANYTMVAKVAKRYVPAVELYGGAHARLRAIADAHRRSR
jgi:acetamidase/formamidase